jgi:hypothetical protein
VMGLTACGAPEQGKLEREQLAKDLEEGRAPAIELPAAAGRGRGMTMPAWMRKKMWVRYSRS